VQQRRGRPERNARSQLAIQIDKRALKPKESRKRDVKAKEKLSLQDRKSRLKDLIK
jgi:hypothetical protein